MLVVRGEESRRFGAFVALALFVASCGGSSDSGASPQTASSSTTTAVSPTTDVGVPSNPSPASGIDVTTDLTFAETLHEGAETGLVDVYARTGAGSWPAVVIFTGSSSSKSTDSFKALAFDIAEQGAVVFVPDVRRGNAPSMARQDNGAPMREMLEGVACAVRFARDSMTAFGSSSDRMILVGQSAGGYGALWAALVEDNVMSVWDDYAANHDGPSQQLSCVAQGVSAEVDVFVGYAGGYRVFELVDDPDLEDLLAVLSPDTHIGANSDLVIRMLAGTMDGIVPEPIQQRHLDLSRLLIENGYDTTYTMVEAGHFLTDASHDPILEAVVAQL